MTHAFFKALLFMGAGSVIGAMAGIQDMDRMGGFRRAMPFTFVTFTVGALALAGFPLTAGFFSKDEIIAFAINRGDWYVALAIAGYLGAFLTAFYAFRMVFRVFYGEPVPEARELEGGHIAHGEPMNPMTGEPEDTDVGFPGPEHHVAERAWPMKGAMGPLALLSIVGGIVAIPGISDILEKFLEGTFHDSRFHDTAPTTGAEVWGLVVGGAISILGIGLAWWVYVRQPGTAARVRERYAWLHRFLVNKWYFDELYEAMFVRPVATIGAFSRRVIETEFVQGTIVGGATGIVRVGTSLARSIQTGYLRAYALLLLLGVAGLTLYFLVTSS
jgi:NADH-quinone oxidoreductase subunit L